LTAAQALKAWREGLRTRLPARHALDCALCSTGALARYAKDSRYLKPPAPHPAAQTVSGTTFVFRAPTKKAGIPEDPGPCHQKVK